MNNRIVIIYKSRTGFTKKYAEMIAEEIGCTLFDLKDITADTISGFDTIVFGSRLHAGTIEGLKKARKIFVKSEAKHFALFVTGASPNTEKDILNEMWKNNLTSDEISLLPHFYLQSGLCYEKMSLWDKTMMKIVSIMLKMKKEKDSYETAFEQAISKSYDISSKEYIMPLVDFLKNECRDETTS